MADRKQLPRWMSRGSAFTRRWSRRGCRSKWCMIVCSISEHVDQFRTLIFPNIAALSTEQCKQISEFVERGGSIIATYETSLYDEWGVQRKDFGLASLFGASYAGKKEGPMQNSYLELKKDPATGQHHPLVAGFEDAGRIINTIRRVHVTATNEGQYSPLTMIPTYPDLPMEECFPPKEKTHDAGVFVRQVGKGRVIYFPGRYGSYVLGCDELRPCDGCCATQWRGPPMSLHRCRSKAKACWMFRSGDRRTP